MSEDIEITNDSGESPKRIDIPHNATGERLDIVLVKQLEPLSRAQIQRLISDGFVTISGKRVKASLRLRGGERVLVTNPPPVDTNLVAEQIPIQIIYEDKDLILVDKEAGMVVHPAAGHESGTLVNAILAYCPDLKGIGGENRPGIIHRLDKDTSGLILVAKNDNALQFLQKQFKQRMVEKRYKALVDGNFPKNEMLIDAPIGRDPRNRKRMAVIPVNASAKARPAQTKVQIIKAYSDHTLVECRPITGRTHQIRIHLSFSGYPIIGDPVYGRRKLRLPLNRQFLHASGISFDRLSDGKRLSFESSLPTDLQSIIDSLEDKLEV